MSETPRTDAHATPKGEDGTDWINADFARLLERELATLHEQLSERDAEIARLKRHAVEPRIWKKEDAMSADKITPSETPRALPEYVKCITDDGQELPMRRCPTCKKPSFIGYRCDGCDLAAERERADRNQEDAERYRYLRIHPSVASETLPSSYQRFWCLVELGAAIDAERRK